mmetsp:Transcript_34794/g.98646  ORF Transcript_34794/g.98646 Transcript_34794/m.98646 type:complete len:151 (+) Transcript_34794:671-1123(+)
MLKVAVERGMNITVQLEPAPPEVLFGYACQAMGLIHYAERDENPRVVYEMLYACLPLFLTRQARVVEVLERQPFVKATDFDFTAKESAAISARVSSDFHEFVALAESVRRHGHRTIEAFLEGSLVEERVYSKLCVRMGVCREVPNYEVMP